MGSMRKNLDTLVLCEFGATDDPALAMWMQGDGTFVNGSKEGNQRDYDHREIARFYPGKSDCDAIQAYMAHGAVRMGCSEDCFSFEFTRPLTREQKEKLSKWAWRSIANKTQFCAIRYGRKKYRICEDAMQFLAYLANYCHFATMPPRHLLPKVAEELGILGIKEDTYG